MGECHQFVRTQDQLNLGHFALLPTVSAAFCALCGEAPKADGAQPTAHSHHPLLGTHLPLDMDMHAHRVVPDWGRRSTADGTGLGWHKQFKGGAQLNEWGGGVGSEWKDGLRPTVNSMGRALSNCCCWELLLQSGAEMLPAAGGCCAEWLAAAMGGGAGTEWERKGLCICTWTNCQIGHCFIGPLPLPHLFGRFRQFLLQCGGLDGGLRGLVNEGHFVAKVGRKGAFAERFRLGAWHNSPCHSQFGPTGPVWTAARRGQRS